MYFEKADYLFKIIIVGDSGVGKSSLLLRFADDDYHENFFPTIGVDFKLKTIHHEDKSIKLNIWDTAGQERFQTICCSYYKGADGILIVYDVTDRQSFKSVEKWFSQVDELSVKDSKKILIGNKADRESMRMVSYEEGKAVADKLGMEFIETSAKTGYEVNEAFSKLAVNLMKEQALANAARILPKVNPRPIVLEADKTKESLWTRLREWCCFL